MKREERDVGFEGSLRRGEQVCVGVHPPDQGDEGHAKVCGEGWERMFGHEDGFEDVIVGVHAEVLRRVRPRAKVSGRDWAQSAHKRGRYEQIVSRRGQKHMRLARRVTDSCQPASGRHAATPPAHAAH